MAQYLTLINTAINDFDKVWTALNTKGTVVADYVTASQTLSTGDPIATSHYGDIIGKLTYIPGLTSNTVAHFTSASEAQDLGAVTVAKGTGNVYTVSTSVADAGYYAVGAKLTGSLNYSSVNLTASNTEWVLDEKTGIYSLSATNYVIGTITAAQGTVSNTGSIGYAIDKAASTNLTFADPVTSNVTLVEEKESSYAITIGASALTTGKVVASVTNSVTEGFVTADDSAVKWEDEIDISSNDSDSLTVYIKEGSVKVQSVSGSNAVASIGSTTGGVLVDADKRVADTNYIELTSTIEGLSIEAEVTEGYVSGGKVDAKADDINLGTGKKYIKVGQSKNQTITLTDSELAVKAGTEYLATSGKTVTLNVPANSTRTADIDAGYITTPGTITLAGEKTINIKEGTGIAKATVTNYTLTKGTTGLKVSETGASGDFSFTVAPTVSVDTTGFDAGWIDSITTTGNGTNHVANKTYYIGAGKLTISSAPTFSAEVVDRQDGKDGLAIGDIFSTAIPDEGDYIKIDSSIGYNLTEGYVTAQSGTPAVTRYLKKAVIERIENEDGTEEYFSVKEAGYLPSGTLTAISAYEPSAASVAVTLTGIGLTNVAPAADKANNYHTITISKGLTDAGYISASKGSLTGTYYLQKGAVSTNTTISATPKSEIARTAADGVVKYTVTSEVTANSNLDVDAGYVTTTEVTGTPSKKQDVNYEIARASFGATTHTTNASINKAAGIRVAEGSETSAYTVAPKIDSCSTVFTVATAGYISAQDTDILKFENDSVDHNGTMTGISIHAGTGITTHEETQTNVTVVDNFASEQTGAYTVTVGGTVASTITLDEGYYGAAEKTKTANFEVSKTLSVAHGSATVTTAGTTSLSAVADGVKLHGEKEQGKNYYEITANTNITASKASVTPGYMKTGDITVSGNTSTGNSFVEAFDGSIRSTSNVAPEGTQNFTITVGQENANIIADAGTVIATAEKYSRKDIAITLSENAMGSAVIAQFNALEARLAGTSAKILG